MKGKLQQTTFLDTQNRVLEEFTYGYSSEKIRNRYLGNHLISRTYYYHSDSEPPGYVTITKRIFTYDQNGRLKHMAFASGSLASDGWKGTEAFKRITGSDDVWYSYAGLYDTITSHKPIAPPTSSDVADINIDRWEHNAKGQPIRNFRLQVDRSQGRHDTIFYSSHRLTYNKFGKLDKAWFDLMYLGLFYSPAGPDTTYYKYDNLNRLVREEHIYTLDMRNKPEIDTTHLDKFWRQSITIARQRFFVGDTIFHNNNKIDIINYQYEPFNAAKHLPLHVSTDIGH